MNSAIAVVKQKMTDSRRQFFAAVKKSEFQGLRAPAHLRRRTPNFDIDEIRRVIQRKLNGPGNMGGYRSMWHALRTEGHQVPRRIVEELTRELDPEGCETRCAKRLRRRTYRVPGPNYCWHTDGYDKLKP